MTATNGIRAAGQTRIPRPINSDALLAEQAGHATAELAALPILLLTWKAREGAAWAE